ncbi:MAG: CinA family protein [Deltaproteobacteria bacterium]|nr:CinA family protein [Deltaproteobacteria bacterium]MBW2123996.1 CinA family protein [Deltaproteobacteria bacterium]
MRVEERIGRRLRREGATISVAESCTGGLIAHRITNVSGSSDYFESGVVSYSNESKADLLGVRLSLIDDHGAVSEPVARAMAEGIRRKRNTTLGLATTGVAGPLGGTARSPVGTVFIALSGPNGTAVRRFCFKGTRLKVKRLAADKALEMVLEYYEERDTIG